MKKERGLHEMLTDREDLCKTIHKCFGDNKNNPMPLELQDRLWKIVCGTTATQMRMIEVLKQDMQVMDILRAKIEQNTISYHDAELLMMDIIALYDIFIPHDPSKFEEEKLKKR